MGTITKINDYDVIQTFTRRVRSRRCVEDVARKEPKTVKELIMIVHQAAKAEDALLFVKERDQGIKRSQPELDNDAAKSKHKKNSNGGKGKKTKADEVFTSIRHPLGQAFRLILEQELHTGHW